MKKLVIFDLDGTLLNTIEDLGHAVNYGLEKNAYPTHPISDYYNMVGGGVRNLVKRALGEGYKEDDPAVDTVLADFFVFYRAAIDRYTRPYPGMVELLQKLQAEGCLLAVASNKFQDGTEALVRRFFPGISFVAILGNRPGAPLKPSPMIVQEIANACNHPVSAVLVGDSGTDIATARAASIPAIAVTWGFRSREELAEADIIVDDASELYKAINN